MQDLNIAIAGAGIAGLCAGAALAQAGHRVRIYDQFDTPAPIGSGLMLQPVGQSVLDLMGVLPEVADMGARIDGLRGWDEHHRWPILNADYDPRHMTGNFGIAVHRSTLFDILLRHAQKSGVDILAGHRVSGITNYQSRKLRFENGTESESFDLVIDACGAGSPLSPLTSRALAFGAIWGTVDWVEDTEFPANHLTQRYSRAQKMAGVLPLGRIPGSKHPKAAVFWSLKADEVAAWQAAPLRNWLEETAALWPASAPFFSQISRHADMTPAFYSHGTLGKWHAPGLMHIGDAAHRTSPQLGQGANMALLDAWALAMAIDHCDSLPKALKTAQKIRMRHLRVFQNLSRVFTPMYQSDNRVLPFLRNWMLAPLTGLAPFAGLLAKIAGGELVAPLREGVIRDGQG